MYKRQEILLPMLLCCLFLHKRLCIKEHSRQQIQSNLLPTCCLKHSKNMKQRTFTKELRGVVEPVGWEYPRNNHAPLNFFHKADSKAFNDIDGYSHFTPDSINNNRVQPLIRRDQR